MRLLACLVPLGLTLALSCTQKAVDKGAAAKPASGKRGNSEDISPVKKQASDAKSSSGNAPGPNEHGGADDEISIPNNIAGAHLTCAVRKEASPSSLETEIGCLLADPGSYKKVAADAKLSFTNNIPMQVNSELQPESSIYHVLYRIRGENRDAILQLTQNLEAIVLYSDKNIKSEKVSRVLKPAIELEDYQAPIVREQSIDKDDSGSL